MTGRSITINKRDRVVTEEMISISKLGACSAQAIVDASLKDSPGCLPSTSFAVVGDVVDDEFQDNLLRSAGVLRSGASDFGWPATCQARLHRCSVDGRGCRLHNIR